MAYGVDIVRGKHLSPMTCHFRKRAGSGSDDRATTSHGFKNGQPEAFVKRRHEEKLCVTEEGGEIAGCKISGVHQVQCSPIAASARCFQTLNWAVHNSLEVHRRF